MKELIEIITYKFEEYQYDKFDLEYLLFKEDSKNNTQKRYGICL